MRVIHKEGPIVPCQPFTIEDFDKVVHFGVQGTRMYVWVERDLERFRAHTTQLLVVATGQDYEQWWKHKGSLNHPNGLVWHLLEEVDPILEIAKI